MNIKTILILLAIAAALFFIGRFTAPKPVKDYKPQLDSIKLASKAIDVILKQNDDSISFYKNKANQMYQQADGEQKVKIIYKIQYAKDTTYNHHITAVRRDSVIRAIFLR